jgi:hypothetical protein
LGLFCPIPGRYLLFSITCWLCFAQKVALTHHEMLALNVLEANTVDPSFCQALQSPDPSVARALQVVFVMVRHKQRRMSLIRRDIPALVVDFCHPGTPHR